MIIYKYILLFIMYLYCRIEINALLKVNKDLLVDTEFQSSVVNPLFGYILSKNMLFNLRKYYFGLDPDPIYKINGNRDFEKDKATDGISFLLINFFSIDSIDDVTIASDSMFVQKYFVDKEIRKKSIEMMSLMFISLLTFNKENHENLIFFKEKFDNFFVNQEMTKLFIEDFSKDREKSILSLLLIHSFVLKIVLNKEEYSWYLKAIIDNIPTRDFLREEGNTIDKIKLTNHTNDSKRDIIVSFYTDYKTTYQYSKKNQPAPSVQLFYKAKNDKNGFDYKSFNDHVEIFLLHLCNILFYNEETECYELDHLNLDETSNLLMFYKKYQRPFNVTYDVREDWFKVVEGLDDILFDNKIINELGIINYTIKEQKKQICCGFINILTVLTKICMSEKNNVKERYIIIII